MRTGVHPWVRHSTDGVLVPALGDAVLGQWCQTHTERGPILEDPLGSCLAMLSRKPGFFG